MINKFHKISFCGNEDFLVILYLTRFLLFSISLIFFCVSIVIIDFNRFSLEISSSINLFRDSCFSLVVDYVRIIFLSIVLIISRIIFLYRKFYIVYNLKEDNSDNSRFFYLLILFVISIVILVFSNSWIILIIGWDGLGVVSFLLVIYYRNRSRLDSGIITILINRFGDCLFIISTILIFYVGVFSLDFIFLSDLLLFPLLVFFGAITKRAQIPFSSWLPAAMAAPTPVSSLVHSSTLVTAGIFVIIRFNHTLYPVYNFIIILSLGTILLGGIRACYELDFKKVVAISTLSQLGFMVFSLSVGCWFLCLSHVIFHAFFKSSLFIRTGNLINFIRGNQDSRSFGSIGIGHISKIIFSLRALRLMGFPFSLGFYSKDLIIVELRIPYFSFLSLLFFLRCCFTVSYRIRIISLSFFNFPSCKSYFFMDEHKFFIFPAFLLYLINVFLGDYYSRVYFIFNPCRIIDLSWGLCIIFIGVLIYFITPKILALKKVFYSIVFLYFLSAPKISLFWEGSTSYTHEISWMEILGAKGVKIIFHDLCYFYNSYKLNFYGLFLISLILIIINFS